MYHKDHTVQYYCHKFWSIVYSSNKLSQSHTCRHVVNVQSLSRFLNIVQNLPCLHLASLPSAVSQARPITSCVRPFLPCLRESNLPQSTSLSGSFRSASLSGPLLCRPWQSPFLSIPLAPIFLRLESNGGPGHSRTHPSCPCFLCSRSRRRRNDTT